MFPIYILAGGLATRLGNISSYTPKSLIDINGKPFLHYQLQKLIENNFIDITLCIGHLGEQIENYIKNSCYSNINISFSHDGPTKLGTGGALKKAIKHQKSPFFVMYGDSYLDIDYKKVQEKYESNKASPLMTIYKNKNMYDKSNVLLDGKVIRYSKKDKMKNAQYIDYGLSIFKNSHLEKFDSSFELSQVQEYFSKKSMIQVYVSKNRFYEVGSLEGISELKSIL